MGQRLVSLWKGNRPFIVFIVLLLAFRSVIADWNVVPTGSMKPTILEGDRILVNKMAYDLRLPFTHISLLKHGDPARGEIIIFDSGAADKRMVKRVVGLPGDWIAMHDNRLWVNGRQIGYSDAERAAGWQDRIENLDGVEHWVRWLDEESGLSGFPPVKVPDGHYLVLGDNRDNSADSRVIGFVPRQEIIGRARHVLLSLNHENHYMPRPHRFMHRL